MGYGVVFTVLLGAALAAAPTAAGQTSADSEPFGSTRPKRSWQHAAGVSLGVLLAPGEIGRGPNATGGHEDLIARLEDAVALSAHWGIENQVFGFELRLVSGTSPIEVENDFGVPFPNHGEPPLLWTAGLVVYWSEGGRCRGRPRPRRFQQPVRCGISLCGAPPV